MKKLNYFLTLFIFLASLVPQANVFAQEDGIETIQPDGASGYDTYMSSTANTTNFGSEETMTIGSTDSGTFWTEIEETDPLVSYSATYTSWSYASHHGGAVVYNNTTSAYYSYTAVTSGFRLYAYKYANCGIVEIFVDDVSMGTVDLYNATPLYQELVYEVDGLSAASHTIKVVNTGTKNASSTDYYGFLDYFSSIVVGDTSRGLITFDMSTFANDIVVENATLSLWVAADMADEASTLQAFTLKRDWGEDWANFTRYDNLDGSGASWQDVLWEIAGADGSDDRLEEPSGEYALAADLTEGTLVTIVLNPDDITQMIRENYFGFVLRTEMESNDAYQFYTSDYETDPDKRPMLFITYTFNNPPPDITWNCVTVALDCWPPMNPLVAVADPFNYKKNSITTLDGMGGGYGGPNADITPMIGAKMNCEPYPLCKDDFPIYYRMYFEHSWTSSGGLQNENIWGVNSLKMPGGIEVETAFTGCNNTGQWQASGGCFGAMQGVIEPEEINVTSQTYDFSLIVGFNFGTGFPVTSTANVKLYLSLEPFTEECADTYTTPLVDTINIDPTIETPVGMFGDETPVDEQGYPTVNGQIYMVRVQQGPWNDGTAERYDTQVSLDGTTWKTLLEFSSEALCVEVDVTNPDWLTVYFTATTETFYIRVNDTAGAFADNTIPYAETPLQYVIGLSTLIGEVDCSEQFTDEEFYTSTLLSSTMQEQQVSGFMNPIIPNEWYGIEVVSGTWTDAPAAEERTDLEFKFDGGGNRVQDWQVLQEGSQLVYCESADKNIVFVQALAAEYQELLLRVNDQDNPKDWADNSGVLTINIYHYTFVRLPHGCELDYNIGNFMYDGDVPANASNGDGFAWVSDDTSANQLVDPDALLFGRIYALDTTDGPWSLQYDDFPEDEYTNNTEYYDVKIKSDISWVKPEEWEDALCVAKLDGQGHQRIFFQTPPSGEKNYFISVGLPDPFANGSMGWKLYEAYGETETGVDCSSYAYDPNEDYANGWIDSTLQNGQSISGVAFSDEPMIAYYAIEIVANLELTDEPLLRKSGWWEDASLTEEKDTLEISKNGAEWMQPDASPDVLCHKVLENGNVVFFIKSEKAGWSLRAGPESSGVWNDNVGEEYYKVYHVDANNDPWVSCLDDYDLLDPALNGQESIPVKDENGVYLLPDNTTPEEVDLNGDGLIWWENLWLMPDNMYMVRTQSGPWDDNDPEVTHDDKAAYLSSDDGENWYPFESHPNVVCYVQEPEPGRYWHAVFSVAEGEKWKIRVADSDGAFEDNLGTLGYGLYLVGECYLDEGCYLPPPPVCNPLTDPECGSPGEVFDICMTALVSPVFAKPILSPISPPEITDLFDLGEYLGQWIENMRDYLGHWISSLGDYVGGWSSYSLRSATQYFAWCQRHTDTLMGAFKGLESKEPLGTISELGTVVEDIEAEFQGYDWDNSGPNGLSGNGPVDTSIFDFGNKDKMGPFSSYSPSQAADHIFETYIMPQSGQAYDVWDGGDLVNLEQNTGLPEYYYTCNTVFTEFLPARLRSGVCFASAYWKETGASWWIQLLLDLGAIFALFAIVKDSVRSLVYMMTGVRIWTKDGILKVASEYGNMNAAAEVERQTQLERDRLIRDLEDFRRGR